MNQFYFKIFNGLLEPKHVKQMAESVWLYMWLQEKCTSVNENGEGKVLGNRPVLYDEDIKPALGISRATYKRWVNILREADYIKTLRTPRGLVIVINKAKKFEVKSDGSNPTITPKNEKVMAHKRTSDGSNSYRDGSNSTIQYNNKQPKDNKTNTTNVVLADTPKSFGKPEINDLFDYWAEMVGSPITAQLTANRRAANNLIKKYGTPTVKKMIGGVAYSHGERYAPRVANFSQLQSKWDELIVWGRQHKSDHSVEKGVKL